MRRNKRSAGEDGSDDQRRRRDVASRSRNDILGEGSSRNLPYGGKIVMARRTKDTWPLVTLQVSGVVLALVLIYLSYFHASSLQFFATFALAKLGHDDAQHVIGQKYLQGHEVIQDFDQAVYWFHLAAKQGHPRASYNLAIAHLQGFNTSITHDKVRHLIHHAAKFGVEEAHHALKRFCHMSDCEDA